LRAAGRLGIAQIIVPGCMDMVNFWERSTVPARHATRMLHEWTPQVTLMRTSLEENRLLGRELARRINGGCGPTAVYLPLRGLSMLDRHDGPFWWPEADHCLFSSLRAELDQRIEVHEVDAHINDDIFADLLSQRLLQLIDQCPQEAICPS
jgi:uncharacterized protein (UPF0261 family)